MKFTTFVILLKASVIAPLDVIVRSNAPFTVLEKVTVVSESTVLPVSVTAPV